MLRFLSDSLLQHMYHTITPISRGVLPDVYHPAFQHILKPATRLLQLSSSRANLNTYKCRIIFSHKSEHNVSNSPGLSYSRLVIQSVSFPADTSAQWMLPLSVGYPITMQTIAYQISDRFQLQSPAVTEQCRAKRLYRQTCLLIRFHTLSHNNSVNT